MAVCTNYKNISSIFYTPHCMHEKNHSYKKLTGKRIYNVFITVPHIHFKQL